MLPAEAKVFNPENPYILEVGMYVKIGVECNNGRTEKFWALVTHITPDIHVRVNQDLYLTPLHGLKDESPMLIEPKHIVAYIPKDSDDSTGSVVVKH